MAIRAPTLSEAFEGEGGGMMGRIDPEVPWPLIMEEIFSHKVGRGGVKFRIAH